MNYSISILENQHETIKSHLYSGDGKESVAIALCGQYKYLDECRLLIQKIFLLPNDESVNRDVNYIKWKTEKLVPCLKEAQESGLSIIKIHSHPSDFREFSALDDEADKALFPCIHNWIEKELVHASVIMLPDGSMFGRVVTATGEFIKISVIKYIGKYIKFWFPDKLEDVEVSALALRNIQAFGKGTINLLKKLTIGVIGCSGTGSLVIEQLARIGVGNLILIDPDIVELKNLNRIPQATMEDALNNIPKVDLMKRSIEKIGYRTNVQALQINICDSQESIKLLAGCDILFGCVDSIEGRNIINKIATFYLIPYFDVGIKLQADGQGGVSLVCGTVHYLQPGKSSLLSRKVYTSESLNAESMHRKKPEEYEKLFNEKYIKGVNVDAPAVIPVNMILSGFCVMELLTRIHDIKSESDMDYGEIIVWIDQNTMKTHTEKSLDAGHNLIKYVGRGDINPLLDMPEYTEVL